jgi:cytidylate kinase
MRSNVLLKALIQNKGIIGIMAAFLLLLPLLAMRISDEVVWDLADFAVAWALLVGAGLTYKLATRKAGNIAYRAAVGVAVATALILVWVNLAVGLIGNEENPANLMYGGVLAVGIIGAIIARFPPHGMARALFATALAQMLVGVIALIAIDGYGGSGKSTLAGALASRLPGATVVRTDDFARPNVPGWDWKRMKVQVLDPLNRNETAKYQRHDWHQDALAERHEVPVGGMVIVEGVSSMRKELGPYWDLAVWVTCSRELRLARGIARDGKLSDPSGRTSGCRRRTNTPRRRGPINARMWLSTVRDHWRYESDPSSDETLCLTRLR